jgi:hypothetical protein
MNIERILITGSVTNSDEESVRIYQSLLSMINIKKYQVSTPLDTMMFKGNDYERYERAMMLLQDTKLMIAEMSNVSTGQGMELQQAVILNIPILVIAKQGSKISGLVKGCKNVKNIIYYNKIEDISNDIKKFISENI